MNNSTTMAAKKIGFACKLSEVCPKNGVVSIPKYNTRTTTISWLNRQERNVAEQRLWDLLIYNTDATFNLVQQIGELDNDLRMVRISSDLLPAFTEPSWRYFWKQADVDAESQRRFARIGAEAKRKNVRLSFHPGQFCVLASDSENVVTRSLEDFEYHATMAKWMGYGQRFQDFKINVHISGKQGPNGIKKILPKLSPEARNCLTIENDEISWGLEDSLELADNCALVLDIHHHFIKTGEYIEANDQLIKRIIESWRGIRPVIHYSVSREDVLRDHSPSRRPNLQILLEQGYKKSKLRAHSDYLWNNEVNLWALSHLGWADIMVEAKSKNLASFALYEFSKNI